MFEHQENLNYSDLEELNKNLLELQHTVILWLYIISSVFIIFILFVLCLTYANYIHTKNYRKKLEDESKLNLLKYSDVGSDKLNN